MRDLIALHTGKLAEFAVADALQPRRPAKEHWNAVRRSIKADLALDWAGWYGQVVIEADACVRHAMVQERGWTDRKGRPHDRRPRWRTTAGRACRCRGMPP